LFCIDDRTGYFSWLDVMGLSVGYSEIFVHKTAIWILTNNIEIARQSILVFTHDAVVQ
jgi:hypothetical protein